MVTLVYLHGVLGSWMDFTDFLWDIAQRQARLKSCSGFGDLHITYIVLDNTTSKAPLARPFCRDMVMG